MRREEKEKEAIKYLQKLIKDIQVGRVEPLEVLLELERSEKEVFYQERPSRFWLLTLRFIERG